MNITTPSGKQVELVENLTVRNRNKIRSVLIGKKLMTASGEMNMDNLVGDELDVLEKLVIDTCVISYDGINENIYDLLGDSTDVNDYDFIVKKCMEKLNANLAQSEGTGGDSSSPKTSSPDQQ